MADQIKNLFNKFKSNKFKKAGPGHRLNEPQPEQRRREEKTSSTPRPETCDEAKRAGAAALARMASTSSQPPLASAMATVQPECALKQGFPKKKDENSFAVQGVYFKCPFIGPEILSFDEWKEKIKSFLYEQLEFESEKGLTACLIIHSCNKSRDKVEQCIETLSTYLSNLLSNPTEEKFQKIRFGNRMFQDKVAKIEGAVLLLEAAGFEKVFIPEQDNQEFLIYNSERSSEANLEMLLDALKCAEPISIELDRNVQVLLPLQASTKVNLPDEFYALTSEELKREQELKAERLESSMQLKTKAMREKEELREMKKYRFAIIRIRFPDGIFLQGTFGVYEKFKCVREFVAENLAIEDDFSLKSTLGVEISSSDDETSLINLHLVPASVLTFSWENSSSPSAKYLKDELLLTVREL